MSIFAVSSIYTYQPDTESGCDKYGFSVAFKGSLYSDDKVPQFTYSGRQEMIYSGYHSEEELYTRLRNEFNTTLKALIISNDLQNASITGCGFTISFERIFERLKNEFPSRIVTSMDDIPGAVVMGKECLDKSPIVNQGQVFVTKFGKVMLNRVTDNNSGQITVIPDGYPSVTRSTVDGRVESFYEGLMTVTTNFFTLGGAGAHFWVCGFVPDPPQMCNQEFIFKDQNGNPLNGNVAIGTTNLTVLGTGTISLEVGTSITAIATYSDLPKQTMTMTACGNAVVFTFDLTTPDVPPDEPDEPDEPDIPDIPDIPDVPEPDDDGKISICKVYAHLFPKLPSLPEKMCSVRVPYPGFMEKSRKAKRAELIKINNTTLSGEEYTPSERALRFENRY